MKPNRNFAMLVCCLLLSASGVAAAQDTGSEPASTQGSSSEEEHRMSQELIKSLVGTWEGNCRAWFEPDKLADEATVKGAFEPLLDGRFVRHTYTGTIQGKPRHGGETTAFNSATKMFEVAWYDDFHMNYGIMYSQGQPTAHGFTVAG